MTAINIIITGQITKRKRIAFLTDGAVYDANGVLLGFGTKVLPIAHLRAGIAARGSVFALPAYAAHLGDAFATFDDLVANGQDVVERVYDEALYKMAESRETEIEVVIAGFSEATAAPAIYVAASRDTYGTPFAFCRMPDAVFAPGPIDEALAARGFKFIEDFELRFRPEVDGLWLLEEQRSRPWSITSGDDREGFVIGGFVHLTEIAPDGTSIQKILKRWPDKVGSKIAPELPETAAGESRLRREMREKRERKLMGAR